MKFVITLVPVLLASGIYWAIRDETPDQDAKQELPSLYTFDDYDMCLFNATSIVASTYCMVYAQILPDNSSELWRKIAAHKMHKFHYHHDKLFFGVCLEKCMPFLEANDYNENSSNSTGILDKEILEYFEMVHKRPLDTEMRLKYSSQIEKCINEEFQKKYDLQLETFIEYCERSPEEKPSQQDMAEILLYKVFKFIIGMVILSSIYDYYLKPHQTEESQSNDFLRNDHKDPDPKQELPSLYTFDDYDMCLFNATSVVASTYCMVYAQILPDNSSELWRRIAAHKMHKFHYHYDKLFFGVCLEKCMPFLEANDYNENSSNSTGILDKEILEYFEMVHKRPLDIEMRLKYSSQIEKCINEEFQKKYDLQLETFIEYCERSPEGKASQKDMAEILFYKMFKCIIGLIILSSVYDYYLKIHQTEENQSNDFFKNDHKDTVSRLLTSFSLPRNYSRLIQPHRGKISNEFSYLDGFRSVCTLMVLQGHTIYVEFLHVQNPEFFENFAESSIGLWLLNSSIVIEIYMVMSGLLFYVKFKEVNYVTPETSWRKCMKLFVIIVFGRLLRFLPSVALIVWINGTVLSSLTDGPFWRHISEFSRTFSRENWWQNIFMITNFTPKTSASLHTWYIAADFQLFAIYTLILIFISKYPQYTKRVLITLSFLTVLIPTAINYALKLETTFMVKPESYRYGFIKDMPFFYYHYIPFYTNLGGYLFGIWFGDLYLKYLSKDEFQRNFRGVLKYGIGVWLVALPMAISIIQMGTITIFQQPSIWTAFFSGINRNLWIVFVCGTAILTMACKAERLIYDFCCSPIFRVLARLSFQMYLWHFLVLQITNGYQRQPRHMNQIYLNGQGLITILLSIIVAVFACLLIEYPLGQVIDALMINLKPMPRIEITTTIKIAKNYDERNRKIEAWEPSHFSSKSNSSHTSSGSSKQADSIKEFLPI
ncbi:uncharacterized protein LOC142238146 isoform X2 [Haematobia irritans]|uniref:uncharacterized protein LOC142238146 isoform X2 n=1 Tax=Haematobia irritans TaxID=7368 RepID=UPI003F4FDDBA